MDLYLARQPILDKKLKVKGYELLYRSGAGADSFSGENADYASATTAIESFYATGIAAITGSKPAFVNFTSSLLLQNVATLFQKDLLFIEIQKDTDPTIETINICTELNKRGYTLVLDNFEYDPRYEPFIKLSKIIKFDFLSKTPDKITEMIRRMDVSGKQLAAVRIESYDMFNQAINMGFSLFQGHFFSKPAVLTSKRLVPLKISYVSLINELSDTNDFDFDKIAKIIRQDLALCHKLLKMINSIYYGLLHKVTDIKRALVILGINEIRKWIYFIAVAKTNADKPEELIRISMIRGFFIEQFSNTGKCKYPKETLFLLGIFSLLDVVMEQPMQVALSDIHIPAEISEALINRKGRLYDYLRLIISIEDGNWDETDRLAEVLGISRQQISDYYLAAIKLCEELSK